MEMMQITDMTQFVLDPHDVLLTPTLVSSSDFEPLDTYESLVEPKIIPYIDYHSLVHQTKLNAERYIDNIKKNLNKCHTVYEKLYYIMSSKHFRRGTIEQTQFKKTMEAFKPIIEKRISESQILEFVLPAFPAKGYNPIKASRLSADMAELLSILRMYEFCLAVQHVYEPGAKFTLLSDGRLFHSIFNITLLHTQIYKDSMNQMISNMSIQKHIELLDLQSLIESRNDLFTTANQRIRNPLKLWWDSNRDDERRLSLVRSMISNAQFSMGTKHDLAHLAIDNSLYGTDEKDQISKLRKIGKKIYQYADDSAFEFVLVLYTLREIDLIKRCYPEAIRATVHPKLGQWGFHLVNKESSILPWQGVAYKESDSKWRIKYEFEVIRRKAIPVHLQGDPFPFYYESSEENSEN